MKKETVQNQIQKIVSHDSFKSSKRSVSFLKYVCYKTLNGETDQIKEYTIAIEAFGLNADFDQQQNPRVRVEAKRLRDRLVEYYKTDGRHDAVLISLPKGSYIPEFLYNRNNEENTYKKSTGSDEMEYFFCFENTVLHIVFESRRNLFFDKYDLLNMQLLQYLFIRSKEPDNFKTRVQLDANIRFMNYDRMTGYEIRICSRNSGNQIAASVFPCSEETHPDARKDMNTVYEIADFLMITCKNNR